MGVDKVNVFRANVVDHKPIAVLVLTVLVRNRWLGFVCKTVSQFNITWHVRCTQLFFLLLVLTVSGCSFRNPFASDEATRERTARDRAALLSNVTMLNVDMYDSYYGAEDTNLTEPPVWTVQSGADVVVNLINHGELNHNWAVVKKGVDVPVPYEEGQAGNIILHGIGMVYNNSQTTVTFVAPESGEYQIICTVSGHYPFMQGKLQVVDDAAAEVVEGR